MINKKKLFTALLLAGAAVGVAVAVAGCSAKKTPSATNEDIETSDSAQETAPSATNEDLETSGSVEETAPSATNEDIETSDSAQETAPSATNEGIETSGSAEEVPSFPKFVEKIPATDMLSPLIDCGKLELISYPTKDYFGDGSEITKPAYVYLPFDYDTSKQYNVLYLMHGIGGNEREWGMYDSSSKIKAMLDNLIQRGDIEPFIVVVPNGRSSKDFANTSSDYNSFYKFGQELRNDLIPYIDANYATYADYTEDYDLTETRDHRAMAGLSMGGMQTTNIGMCECLDIISYFGAFSAAPTTYTASKIASCLEEFEKYNVNYYYALCGTEDNIAFSSAQSAVKGLCDLTDKLTDGENFTWQTVSGKHDFNVWNLGFYNFVQLVFKCN